MHTIYLAVVFGCFALVNGHARIKYPRPLAAADDSAGGNHYNGPLRADGGDFPCKGLHKRAGVSKTPTATWQPGEMTHFEILGHNSAWGEGSLAAHSGGSCQASISFDNGETWKVLHSFIGGCPREVRRGSNMAGKNQTFPFMIPVNTKAGNALFSWSWVAVTGNRNEYFQNCASIQIAGSGTSTLDDLPDMFVGDMTLKGQIGAGECRSTAGYALEYPHPGPATTFVTFDNIAFKKPTAGKCFTKPSTTNSTTPIPSNTTTITTKTATTTSKATTATTSKANTATTSKGITAITSKATTTTTSKTTTTTTSKPTTTTTTVMPFSTVSLSANGLPRQCTNYAVITDRTRHKSQPGYITCDKALFKQEPVWVRFSGGAGTRLVKGAAEPFRCGTQGAGWYSGADPANPGDTVTVKVCYSWPGNSCQWSNTISITNCNSFHVYALTAPPACYLRYCTV